MKFIQTRAGRKLSSLDVTFRLAVGAALSGFEEGVSANVCVSVSHTPQALLEFVCAVALTTSIVQPGTMCS